MTSDLSSKRCESCEGIGAALNAEQIKNLLPQLDKHWQVSANNCELKRELSFNNFYETMAYNYCRVSFMTHALNGLTHNDFICAAKMDNLLNE